MILIEFTDTNKQKDMNLFRALLILNLIFIFHHVELLERHSQIKKKIAAMNF